ncbi:aminoglycoside phosphotransferase family protein [Nonomuraea sp. NPDC050663]|uniref:aminoglycoside phosphotransferase family protein n=1 Tax=Nonomuraea sp. NPDC050663 TaxID=3364370 RepID=UPI0037A7F1DC
MDLFTPFVPGIVQTTRLRGGSKKGVYRLTLDSGTTLIAYRWDAAEDYWPAATPGDGPFDHASALDLFLAAHHRLTTLGVRCPRLLDVFPDAHVALVEDLPGGTLEALMETDPARADPARAEPALARLRETLAKLHADHRPEPGRLTRPTALTCPETVLTRALDDLTEAAARDPRMRAAHDSLRTRLHTLTTAVRPRTDHRLIHGELGPDHVLLDSQGEPALIDIEGLMYFDVEWEHVFLRLRFGDRYGSLEVEGLDGGRMELYTLAMRLSLVAGPLRLLDGDFPDRETMRGIAEHNLREALRWA